MLNANLPVAAIMFVVAVILLVRHLRKSDSNAMQLSAIFFRRQTLAMLSTFALLLGSFVAPLSAQRFDSNATRAEAAFDESQQDDVEQTDEKPIMLREGTQIPPAVGRIIPVGRRWGFAPANAELFTQLQATNLRQIERSRAQQAVSQQRPTRLGSATILVRGPDLTRFGSTTDGPPAEEDVIPATTNVQHILLVENLMLQRIVEAVTQDPSDDRWSITGEIFEFRNQNRLLIRTAQRASGR